MERLWPKIIQCGGVSGELKPDKKNGKFKALRAIDKLSKQEFYYKVDNNIGRFHSNLTNIKKELRKYINYDGKTLVNLDIKNSQPLLSGILLNPDFYTPEAKFSIYNFPNINQQTISTLYNTIMLSVCHEAQAYQEFQEYLRIVQSGIFYEELGKALFPGASVDRKDIKTLVLTLFFADNRHGSVLRRKEEPFVERFPTIYKLFCDLKRKDKTLMSHILQKTESLIVIEKATRQIAKEHPNIPIFTVHDSIATTLGNENTVHKILKETIKTTTSLEASIGHEVWAKNDNREINCEA